MNICVCICRNRRCNMLVITQQRFARSLLTLSQRRDISNRSGTSLIACYMPHAAIPAAQYSRQQPTQAVRQRNAPSVMSSKSRFNWSIYSAYFSFDGFLSAFASRARSFLLCPTALVLLDILMRSISSNFFNGNFLISSSDCHAAAKVKCREASGKQ